MANLFEFAAPARIIWGAGSIAQLEAVLRDFGVSRPFIVTGSNPARAAAFVSGEFFPVSGEPTVDLVRRGAELARGCGAVISFGGGSAIDAGKAIAAIATNPGDPLDYLEVVGKGLPLIVTPLPFVAVPTTAGTGSEVTRNAVLGSPEHGVKASLRSPMMLAKVAIVDPELTRELPPHLTASTGLDALTQLIEPYVSRRANPISDAICLDGLQRASQYLRRAFHNGYDTEARENMSLASLFGGLALANAGLGVVHGFAAPIGGMFDAPHGAVCAAVLPHGIPANLRALRQREPGNPALGRYRKIAQVVTGNPDAVAEDAAEFVATLCRDLAIPPLRAYGIGPQHIDELVQKAAKASSMKANPIVLNAGELAAVLEAAI